MFLSRNGSALPAASEAAAKRASRLQERRLFRRRCRRRELFPHTNFPAEAFPVCTSSCAGLCGLLARCSPKAPRRAPRPARPAEYSSAYRWSRRTARRCSCFPGLGVALPRAVPLAGCPAFHPAKRLPHLLRRFFLRMQNKILLRHRIVDHHKRPRSPGSGQRSDGGQRHFFAESPLAVAEKIRLRLARNVISVCQGSRRLGNGDRAERRTRHDFSAVHSFEAQQFNPLAHRRSHEVVAGSYSMEHYVPARMWRRLLCTRHSSAQKQCRTQNRAHAYSAIHYSLSSSLPNCCELFAAAIPAIPFFNRRSTITKACSGISSPKWTAAFTFSQSAIASVISWTSGTHRPLFAQSLLRQPHRLGQPVVSNEQVHLDPFAGALFVHREAQRTKRTALHPHTHNRRIVCFRRQGSRQQSEVPQFVVRHERPGRIRVRGTFLRRMGVILQICVVRLCATILRRRQCRILRSNQMPCCLLLLALPPVAPADRAGQNCRGSQRPRSDYGHAPRFHRAVLRAEFLPQAHLNARGSLRCSGRIRKGVQLDASRLPGILQSRAARAPARVLASRGALQFTQRCVALCIQSNGVKVLTLHRALPFLLVIAPRSRAAARRATSRASPAAARARDAAAIESSRSDIRPLAPLLRSSTLPVRTAPPLRETPPAIPALQREPASSARAFPPRLPESPHPSGQFPRHFRPRFFVPEELPAAIAPDASSRGFAQFRTGIRQAFRGSNRISSERASKS